MRARTLPAGNLDEFRRKLARNDLPLQAIWEAGCRQIRVPAGDLERPETLARLRDLSDRGMALTVYSAGSAALCHAPQVLACRDQVEAWEIISMDGRIPDHAAIHAVRAAGVPVLISCIQQATSDDQSYFSHFPRHGFPASGPDFQTLLSQPCADGLIGVIPFDAHPWTALEFEELAQRLGCPVRVHLELAREQEGLRQTDNLRTARQVAEAVLVARLASRIQIFMEPLVDHDRGYFPRNGLIDRRGDPRPAHKIWVHLERLLPSGPISLCSTSPRVFQTPVGKLYMDGSACDPSMDTEGSLIDLISGSPLDSPPTEPRPVLVWSEPEHDP